MNKLLAGTLVFTLLTSGCNADENDPPDAAGYQPLELNDVQDEIEEPDVIDPLPIESYDTNDPGDAGKDEQQNARQPVIIPPEVINPDYKALLNEVNELIISGRSIDELLELIGEPPHILRQGHPGSGWHKEVWVLPIYQKDSTGLYIYIQNGQVADWRLDTFVGIGNHPQLLEWF